MLLRYILVWFITVNTTYGRPETDSLSIYNPIDYGAVPDGKSLCTRAIQQAIDLCSEKGGGTVQLSNGSYLTGSIFLKSNVQLVIREDAVMLGSTNLKDYPK